MKSIHLGYAVGTGEPVSIPLMHMVVSGQTQQAGKTTTMEALIDRAQLPALAFITKRGEKSFTDERRIEPYFRERADWQFVSSVLEASLREKLKFERAWIMKASKGAQTLAQVQKNVEKAMTKASGMSADVYLTLYNYLDIVVPRVAAITWAKSIELQPGVNVMDLADRERFPVELQGLVMRSALEWVYERGEGCVTIIPEAWEFLPQGRGSPVKLAAESLMRKGAGLGNFVWLDSQDIGGVSKDMLRHCTVWLIGVQREANEIKRTLENIPAGVKRPKPGEVATLKKGQFFACFGEHVIRTYVQPKWMSAADAIAIARGEASGGFITRQEAEQLVGLNSPELVIPGPQQLEARERAGFERGYREGFDKGYAAASATLGGQVEGVIRSASAFMDELREVGKQLAQAQVPSVENQSLAHGRKVTAELHILPTRQSAESWAELYKLTTKRSNGAKKAVASQHATAGKKLLQAIARFPALTWSQACIVAGMTPDNGYFYGGKKWLLENDYVTDDEGDLVSATPEGEAQVLPCGRVSLHELLTLWRPKLKPPGADMLDQLARVPDKAIATQALADLIGRKPGNGYWYGGVKALRKNNLAIDADGALQLSPFLATLTRG